MEPTSTSHTNQSRVVLIVVAIVTVLALAATWAVIIANPSSAPEVADDTPATTITFTDDGVSPARITIKKGTAVTVVNNSSRAIQFSSDDHPAHTDDPELNMSELAPGANGTFTPTHVGTHGFHDHHNDSVTGTITVTE